MRVNIGLRRWLSGLWVQWYEFESDRRGKSRQFQRQREPQLLGPVVQVEPHLPIQNRAEVVGVADDEGGPERCRSRNERFLRFFIGGGKNNEMNPEMKKQVPPFRCSTKLKWAGVVRGGLAWARDWEILGSILATSETFFRSACLSNNFSSH